MKKSPLNRLDKNGLISSAEGAASGAYRKSALNMLGISRKSSPLNDMAGGLTHEEMRKKSPQNLEGHLKNRDAHQRGVSRNSSPLNDYTEQENDSIAAVKAWDTFKSGYMNRSQNTPEYNQKEYDREKNEFYYNTEQNRMKLIPTDDAEVQDEAFKNRLKSYQLPPIDNN